MQLATVEYCGICYCIYIHSVTYTMFSIAIELLLLYYLLVIWNPWAEKAKAMSDFGDDQVNAIQWNLSLWTLCIKDTIGKTSIYKGQV